MRGNRVGETVSNWLNARRQIDKYIEDFTYNFFPFGLEL